MTYQIPIGVHPDACFTDNGKRRLWLSRVIVAGNREPLGRRFALWIGANPSYASENCDDHTIRRETNFTWQWGYNGYFKANVCDLVSTDPKKLLMPGVEPNSPENHMEILKLAKRAQKIVLAFGNMKSLQPLADELVSELRFYKYQLWCLGHTKDGNPRHTSRLANNVQLEPYGES